jgi:hypothetical protein
LQPLWLEIEAKKETIDPIPNHRTGKPGTNVIAIQHCQNFGKGLRYPLIFVLRIIAAI